ncbi:hypothetical protein B0T12DRAFT_163945 [Alternaria alternata]|nr:hypothetical protein B0T12DRAFT_163945 [Alternaria alternata]
MHRIWVVSAPETPPWGWTWKPLIMTTFLLHPRRRSLCGPLQTFAFVTCLLETFVKPLVPAVRLMGSYCCFDTDCKIPIPLIVFFAAAIGLCQASANFLRSSGLRPSS